MYGARRRVHHGGGCTTSSASHPPLLLTSTAAALYFSCGSGCSTMMLHALGPSTAAPAIMPPARPSASPPPITWPTAGQVQPYTPPAWLTDRLSPDALARLPRSRLALLPLPTPVHALTLSGAVTAGLPPGIRLYIKRDDVAVGLLGGSKARKLAFSLAAAAAAGATAVVTAGNAGSNHTAATAVAAARVGLDAHVLLLTDDPADLGGAVAAMGGLAAVHAAVGTRVHLVPAAVHGRIEAALDAAASRLQASVPGGGGVGAAAASPPPRVAVVGMGGSDAVGLFGFLDAWEELRQQGAFGDAAITDVVVPSGSGGTAAGLALAAAAAGNDRICVHAVVVRNDAAHCRRHAARMAAAWGLPPPSEAVLDVIEGYDGGGYGPLVGDGATERLAAAVGAANGLVLDPVYTRKAFAGMLAELAADSGRAAKRFRGGGVLFVHTGGMAGLLGVGGVADPHGESARGWVGAGGMVVDSWSTADVGLV